MVVLVDRDLDGFFRLTIEDEVEPYFIVFEARNREFYEEIRERSVNFMLFIPFDVGLSDPAVKLIGRKVFFCGVRVDFSVNLHEIYCILDESTRNSSGKGNIPGMEVHMTFLDAFHCQGSERSKILR